MSLAKDPTLRDLNDCNCCDGIGARTPVEVFNRPGLSAVAYRIGTHSRFKESMLARLSAKTFPALQDLRTRDDDDFTIALLDAWASVADVLTFYQERIANESYLRTATEDRSLYHLARLIGYNPRPGVAASCYLAFTAEDAQGAPTETKIPKGTRVQSIPSPGEKPQIFETVESIIGRPEWNALKPRMAMEQELSLDMKFALFQGVTTNLKIGDSLLLVKGSNPEEFQQRRVIKVSVNQEKKNTRVNFVAEEIPPPPFFFKAPGQKAHFLVTPMKLTGTVVETRIFNAAWSRDQLFALTKVQKWPVKALVRNLIFQAGKKAVTPNEGIYSLRQKGAIFGHNAPNWEGLDPETRGACWEGRTLGQESPGNNFIYLDRVYEGILPDSWLVLKGSVLSKVFQVISVSEVSRADFTLSGKVTRLELDRKDGFTTFTLRDTSVYLAESEPLELADLPVTDDIPMTEKPNEMILAEPHLELEVGQKIILTGERTDLEGVSGSELLQIGEIEIATGCTRLTFTKDIQNSYRRDSVTLNANVAPATHGERTEEVLGSGDSRVEFQKFRLRQPPLTHVSASDPSGARSTLEVRVDGLQWHEVATLQGCGPSDNVYVLRTDADGQSTVQFGDGRTGSRVPTGVENIHANYRKGMGEEGLVDSGQLKLLLTRPMGVRGVDNPIAANGAEDRESLAQVRRNAPLPVMTLDRIVSLQDYEDFAMAFAGITKAMATWTWDGGRRGVFITVAGPKGAAVSPDGTTCSNLLAAMQKSGNPLVPVRVQTYRPAFFRVEARVKIHMDYEYKAVLKAVEEALRRQYAFENRNFGQDITRGEVITTIQLVPGVVAVDLDIFCRTDSGESTLDSRLTAALPQAGLETPLAAELLTLDPRPVLLGEMP